MRRHELGRGAKASSSSSSDVRCEFRLGRCLKRPTAHSFGEVFNAGDFDAVDEILAADYVHHDPTTHELRSGMEGFKRLIGYSRDAFPDLEISFDDQCAAGSASTASSTAGSPKPGANTTPRESCANWERSLAVAHRRR
jgi:hypothetical protein